MRIAWYVVDETRDGVVVLILKSDGPAYRIPIGEKL